MIKFPDYSYRVPKPTRPSPALGSASYALGQPRFLPWEFQAMFDLGPIAAWRHECERIERINPVWPASARINPTWPTPPGARHD